MLAGATFALTSSASLALGWLGLAEVGGSGDVLQGISYLIGSISALIGAGTSAFLLLSRKRRGAIEEEDALIREYVMRKMLEEADVHNRRAGDPP